MGGSITRKKIISQQGNSGSSGGSPADSARITKLENNVYKITYYEIVSGTSGSLTIPTGATINQGEFGDSGNAILSEINISNKPRFKTPQDAGGNPVTASLNTLTGAWVASGVYTSPTVALMYSVNISALNHSNLNNFYIIESEELDDNTGTSKPLGLIRIVDLQGQLFYDLPTAHAYVAQFNVAGIITDESYVSYGLGVSGVYYFTVPYGSDFSGASFFLGDGVSFIDAYIEDPLGLIGILTDSAFVQNNGNNILKNCKYGYDAFSFTGGVNRLGTIDFIYGSGYNYFANYSTGAFYIEDILNGDLAFFAGSPFGVWATLFLPNKFYPIINTSVLFAYTIGVNVQFEGINLERIDRKGAANGYAPLNAVSRVPADNLGMFEVFMTGGDQSSNSTTSMNITDLVTTTLLANKRYFFWGFLAVDNSNTNGMKIGCSLPAGATGSIRHLTLRTSSAGTSWLPDPCDGNTYGPFNTNTGTTGGYFMGEVTMGATAGVVQFLYASFNGANTTTIKQQATCVNYKLLN